MRKFILGLAGALVALAGGLGVAMAIAAVTSTTVTGNNLVCKAGAATVPCSSSTSLSNGESLTVGANPDPPPPSTVLLGDQSVEATSDSSSAPASEAFGYTASASGTATSASVYLTSTDGATVGLYADSSGKPGTLLDKGSIASNAAGWATVPLNGAVAVASGTRYWIAVGANAGGSVTYRDHGSSGMSLDFSGSGFPDPYSPAAQWNSNPISAYVSGTAPTTSSTSTTATSSTTSTTPSSCPSSIRDVPDGPDPFGGCFPGPQSTGVPAGTTLTSIPGQETSGPGWAWSAADQAVEMNGCGASLNAVKIAGWIVLNSGASNGTHSASTPCVTVTNSEIDGIVQVANTDGSQPGGPLVLTSDLVNVPTADEDRSPVLSANYYATKVNVKGARLGFSCQGSGDCSIIDSYVHDGYLTWNGRSGGGFHYNAVGSNGLDGVGTIVMRHNSLACDFTNDPATSADAANSLANTGGCSDDVGLFGDFGPIANVTTDRNLFISDSHSYGGVPFCYDGGGQTGKAYPNFSNESVTNNVFQRGVQPGNGGSNKCGLYGPLYAWQAGSGNVWSGNTYDDGAVINP